VVIAGTFACLAGSLVTYFITFFGGNYLFERHGKYVGITERAQRLANEWFDKYGKISIFVSRMVPGVRAYSSVPTGICRIDLKKFYSYAFWALTVERRTGFRRVLPRHQLAQHYLYIMYVMVAVLLVFAVVILVLVLYSRRGSGRRM
jgi:membrane protein DedA with SNARE-associated domain